MAPSLRRATADDADAIRDLVTAAYEGYIPLLGRIPIPMLADYHEAVRVHDVWVLDDRVTGIVGVIELIPHPDHLYIENVAVSPARQGEGLGRQLLRLADQEARDRGLTELGLMTNERYTSNIAMYERYGYVETHRTPHLGSDLVHFRKTLA
ncbi:MAG: GNAT family N-acetyltransferase [Chloroflexota bacterium]